MKCGHTTYAYVCGKHVRSVLEGTDEETDIVGISLRDELWLFLNMRSSAILRPCVFTLRHHYPCAKRVRVHSSKEAWQDSLHENTIHFFAFLELRNSQYIALVGS